MHQLKTTSKGIELLQMNAPLKKVELAILVACMKPRTVGEVQNIVSAERQTYYTASKLSKVIGKLIHHDAVALL